MKILIFITSLALLSAPAYAAVTHFEIDPAHSGVNFKVRHMFTPVPGNFKKFSGTFDYDPAKPKSWNADVTIETALALGKTLLNQSFELPAAQLFDLGSQAQAICYTSTEHRDSVMAFLKQSAAPPSRE